MKNTILKKFKVNAFEVKCEDYNITKDELVLCQAHINDFLNDTKSYCGILYMEKIFDNLIVYTYGNIKSCWKIVKTKFQDAEVTPLGEVKAEIIGVEGKHTRRHIFVADCSGSFLKG